MKIDSNDMYNNIPNGTVLKLTVMSDGLPFFDRGDSTLVYKQDWKLIDKTSESTFWWNWHDRNEKDFDFILETTDELDKKEESDKHLKGYIFDSLVFRYQVALERGLPLRVEEYIGRGLSKPEARNQAQMRNNDDLMRFIRVLEEAIGEHD